MSIVNPLPELFSSIGMSTTDVVDAPQLDPVPSSSPTRSDLDEGAGSHYINPSFHRELKKVTDFEMKFSFERNYRVIVLSPTDTVVKPPSSCIVVSGGLKAWPLVFASLGCHANPPNT